jgi:hypothetical protein
MYRTTKHSLAAGLILTAVCACGGGTGDSGGAAASQPPCSICAPGETQRCLCGTRIGSQSCESNGCGWGACTDCSEAAAGGASAVVPGGGGGSNTTGPRSCDGVPISSERVELAGFTPVLQTCQEWCWAASITMLGEYYGGDAVQQCNLATTLAGNLDNCCSYAACGDPMCDQGATADQISDILSIDGLHGNYYPCELAEVDLQAEISAHRPVMIGYEGPFSGHAVVISGFTPGVPATYTLDDPYFGVLELNYQQILLGPNNGQTRWVYTWTQVSPTANLCAPSISYCGPSA